MPDTEKGPATISDPELIKADIEKLANSGYIHLAHFLSSLTETHKRDSVSPSKSSVSSYA